MTAWKGKGIMRRRILASLLCISIMCAVTGCSIGWIPEAWYKSADTETETEQQEKETEETDAETSETEEESAQEEAVLLQDWLKAQDITRREVENDLLGFANFYGLSEAKTETLAITGKEQIQELERDAVLIYLDTDKDTSPEELKDAASYVYPSLILSEYVGVYDAEDKSYSLELYADFSKEADPESIRNKLQITLYYGEVGDTFTEYSFMASEMEEQIEKGYYHEDTIICPGDYGELAVTFFKPGQIEVSYQKTQDKSKELSSVILSKTGEIVAEEYEEGTWRRIYQEILLDTAGFSKVDGSSKMAFLGDLNSDGVPEMLVGRRDGSSAYISRIYTADAGGGIVFDIAVEGYPSIYQNPSNGQVFLKTNYVKKGSGEQHKFWSFSSNSIQCIRSFTVQGTTYGEDVAGVGIYEIDGIASDAATWKYTLDNVEAKFTKTGMIYLESDGREVTREDINALMDAY